MLIGSRDIVYSSLRNFNYNFSYLYVRMGKILRLDHILFGAKPAMIQILVLVSYRLGKRALESWAGGLPKDTRPSLRNKRANSYSFIMI